MRCFYCSAISEKHRDAVLDEHESVHLFKTLRAEKGDMIKLIDGKGTVAEAVVDGPGAVKIVSVCVRTAPPLKIHLYFSPPRKNIMDDLIRQCPEVVIWSLHPIICERTVSVPGKESSLERWKLLLKEGCKQSLNPFFPEIYLPVSLNEALESISACKYNGFFGAPDADMEVFSSSSSDNSDLVWMVGPEGGFTLAEREFMIGTGLKPLSLGANIMRIETAAICGAACIAIRYKLSSVGKK